MSKKKWVLIITAIIVVILVAFLAYGGVFNGVKTDTNNVSDATDSTKATESSTEATTINDTKTSNSEDTYPWTLVWSDEFDGQAIDESKWTFVQGGGGYGNNELQNYTGRPENARIEEGILVIEARKESFQGNSYTSAKMSTQAKAAWTFGKFEIRAQLPEGQGLWPAFWMMPADSAVYGAWPAGGEIDFMEYLGHETDKIYGTLHFGNPHGHKQGTYTLTNGQTFADSYHVYGLEWEPNEIRWYIDGKLYASQNDWYTKDITTADPITFPAPFDRDFYMQLNVAVGGNWGGFPDETTSFPQKMLVDYVRVYELTGRPYNEERDASLQEKAGRAPLEDGNMVYDGGFDVAMTSDSYWTYLQVADFEGKGTPTIEEGMFKLDIQNQGKQTYAMQLIQKPLDIQSGNTYRVSFDAKASTNRSIIAKVGADEDQAYTNYSGDKSIDLSTELKSYGFEFAMTENTNLLSRLEFNLGGRGENSVWIDNVRIEKLSSEISVARKPLLFGNYIYNGTFDQGVGRMGYWTYEVEGDAKAIYAIPSDVYSRNFIGTVTKTGSQASDVQLAQEGLNIVKELTYKVIFTAQVDANRSIQVDVGPKGNDEVSYSGPQTIALTTESNKYAFEFTMTSETDALGTLKFNLGGETGIVTLDTVLFVKKP